MHGIDVIVATQLLKPAVGVARWVQRTDVDSVSWWKHRAPRPTGAHLWGAVMLGPGCQTTPHAHAPHAHAPHAYAHAHAHADACRLLTAVGHILTASRDDQSATLGTCRCCRRRAAATEQSSLHHENTQKNP